MFPTAESPFRAALRQFLDVAIEFATLGEYTLDGPADPAAISPGPRSPRAAASPGVRAERVAAAAGERLALAQAAALRPSTAAARRLGQASEHSEPPAPLHPVYDQDPESGELPPHLALFVGAQAAELARCASAQRRSRSPRRAAPAKRRPGTSKPVPQPCLTAGD
jgi:hypothetical protein